MWKIYWKGEVAAGDNHGKGYVGQWNRTAIPGVYQEQDSLSADSWSSSFLGEYLQPFVQVQIYALNQHRVVVFSASSMDIEIE